MHELVKYGNQMNAVPFKKFNKRDLNIFFAIVSRMRDKGSKDITFSFDKIMKLSGINYHHHLPRFIRDLKATYQKMQGLTMYYSDKDKFVSWVLFTRFEIDKKNNTCTVKVNPDLEGILNRLAKQFTRFSLAEFDRIDSSYAKNMFRLIKQYRTTGRVYLPVKKFRNLMVVPKSYNANAINRRVIKPILVELSPLVGHLRIIKSYGSYGRITAYTVKFLPEAHRQDDLHKGNKNLTDTKWMINNVQLNKYLNPKLKKQAINKIISLPNFLPHRKIPMPKFNEYIKKMNRHELRNWLKLRKQHRMFLTSYQVRKVKRAIRQKDATIERIVNGRPDK